MKKTNQKLGYGEVASAAVEIELPEKVGFETRQ